MRPSVVAAVVLALGLPAVSARAAEPPSGTITCDSLVGIMDYDKGLPTVLAGPSPKRVHVKIKSAISDCDATGVTGGSAAITSVSFDMVGRLAAGSTCADITGTPAFDKTRVKATWLSAPSHPVAVSAAEVVSASYDSGTTSLVVTTSPIKRGAFAGSTLTFRLGIKQPGYDESCQTQDALFGGHFIGPQDSIPDNETSSVSVP